MTGETCNPNSPFHTVDHPENVAAVFYAHMWGNAAWQAAYRNDLNARFGFDVVGHQAPAAQLERCEVFKLQRLPAWLPAADDP